MTMAGDMLSRGRLPGAIELGQPGRGSNRAMPCPKTSPRLVTPTCAPNPLPMLKVTATQFPHLSEVEMFLVPYRISFQCTRIGTLVPLLTAAAIVPAMLFVSGISAGSDGQTFGYPLVTCASIWSQKFVLPFRRKSGGNIP